MKYPTSAQIASLLLLTASFPLGFAQSYRVKDLGAIGGPAGFSVGRAVNRSGQVTGQSGPLNPAIGDVFVHSKGMKNLGTLGGTNAFGEGINVSGQVPLHLSKGSS